MRYLRNLFVLAVTTSLICSCAKKEEEDTATGEEAPIAPPNTLSLGTDLNKVGSASSSLRLHNESYEDLMSELQLATNTTKLNALKGGLVAGTWHIFLSVAFAIPKAALAAAFSQVPTKDADTNVWTWAFDVTSGVKYAVALKGTPVDTGPAASWSMVLNTDSPNANDCCTDFEWMAGSTSGEGIGTWKLRDGSEPEETGFVVEVGYTINSATDRTLVITNTKEGTEEDDFGKDSTLTYNVAGTVLSLTTKNAAKNRTWIIVSDTADGTGSVTDPDGVKGCWDVNQEDVECPAE